MSRKYGGRPGYGWSTQQQGGFRAAERGKLIFKKDPTRPTSEHSLKSNLKRAEKEGWSVESHCENCGRKRRIAAFELIAIHELKPDMRLNALKKQRELIPCRDCKVAGKTSYSYVI